MRLFSILFVLAGIAFVSGCATHGDRIQDARYYYFTGDLDSARISISDELKKKNSKKEADVLELDLAMLDLIEGDTRSAENRLRKVRDKFDHLEQKSLAEGVASMFTDDNARSYCGEDYEKVMIRSMLAIADLMHGGENAFAYANQIAMKQEQIIQNALGKGTEKLATQEGENPNPKSTYKQVALGPYIRGAVREATFTNFDDAERCYQQVVHWEPNFSQGHTDLDRAANGSHTQKGNGALYIFTFVGQGPYKKQVNAEVTQMAMLITDRIVDAFSKRTVTPTFAPVLVPTVVRFPNRIENIGVAINGNPVAATETITDIGKMAEEQYAAIHHHVIARAVARRAFKKTTAYAAQEMLDTNEWLGLAVAAIGVAWEASETADTRCWGLLPDKIQVVRLELPAGEHTVELQACANRGVPIGPKSGERVRILDGRNTYMLANFPEDRLVGIIQSSEQPY